ncbi:SH3 domain-containing protein [Myxococcota bacterium]|nr:SH3 domain-containing protein [Myxococcota bacterium]
MICDLKQEIIGFKLALVRTMPDQTLDPWREELSQKLSEIDEIFDQWLGAWVEAEEASELQAAAANLDSNSVLAAVSQTVSSIEAWYQVQFRTFVQEEARERGLRADRWLAVPQGWLFNGTHTSLVSLRNACGAFESAAEEFADSSARWSGFGGMLRGAARGAMDPLDGLAALFGESSIDKEQQVVQRALKTAASALQAAVAGVLEAVDSAVVDRWNSDIARVATEMEVEANRSRAADAPVHSNSPQFTPVASRQPSSTPWLVLVIVAIVIALGAFWIWGRSDGPNTEVAQTELVSIAPTILRSGPSESFPMVSEVSTPVYAKVLDRSVPGWLKLELAPGNVGWVPSHSIQE